MSRQHNPYSQTGVDMECTSLPYVTPTISLRVNPHLQGTSPPPFVFEETVEPPIQVPHVPMPLNPAAWYPPPYPPFGSSFYSPPWPSYESQHLCFPQSVSPNISSPTTPLQDSRRKKGASPKTKSPSPGISRSASQRSLSFHEESQCSMTHDTVSPASTVVSETPARPTTVTRVQLRYLSLDVMTEPGYNVHDWVIFEGDRGMEIGQITAVDVDPLPLDKALPAVERLPRIVRRASLEEAEEYKRRDEKDEKQVLEFIREELLRLRLASLHITKCSFQWDKVRLTVFFDTPKRKFFVPLLKALNRKYNCRIWMYHVNKSKGAPNENPGVACSSQSE